MEYLNHIFEKLNLSFSVGLETDTINKREVRISNKNIKISFITYILFALVFNIFFYTFSLPNESFKINKKYIISSIIIFLIITIYGIIKRNIIFKTKESKPANINIYNRELPSKLTPAHARMLVFDGLIDKNTLASTILDLIDRGYLKLKTKNRNELFFKEIYIYRTNKKDDKLFDFEKYLIDWFFKEEKTTSTDLKKQLNNVENNPSEKFAIFEGLLLLSFPLKKYYKSYKYKRKLYTICYILFFPFLLIINIIPNVYLFSIFNFISLYGLINLTLCSTSYLLNDEGAELKDKYLDLKKFLLDFSLIHKQTAEMVILWNYYLSYSVALGIKGVAYDDIDNFFGNNIYNINQNKSLDIEEKEKLFSEIPNVIKKSEELYKERKI